MARRGARRPAVFRRLASPKQRSSAQPREQGIVRTLPGRSEPQALHGRRRIMGKVFLVGAGPGDPELLTVKAARVLAQAGVVLYDSLVSAEVLKLVSQSAKLVDVGKRAGLKLLTQDEINSLLVDYAGRYETVVRLKGGD